MTLNLSSEPVVRNEDFAREVSDVVRLIEDQGQAGDMVRLRDLRARAGKCLREGLAQSVPWGEADAPVEDLFSPEPGALPEIDVRDMTIETVRSAMHHHGSLIVRNLLSPERAEHFRRGIDDVIASAQDYSACVGEDGSDPRSTRSKVNFLPMGEASGMTRGRVHKFLGQSGAIETFLSPRLSFELFARYEALGLRGLLQSYFGDEPCVSYQKSVLRRAEPLSYPAEWHQDGAFMNEGIQSLNLWVSLSECGAGTDCPGMDLLPKRLTSIVPPGTNGAAFDWSISGATVAERFSDQTIARPYFGAGDAVFFDHFNLHATSSDPAFTQARYAIETWFFSKGRSATNQLPVYW